MSQEAIHIAWFVTPHGFGHAARSAAIMATLNTLGIYSHEVYTKVPEWFFRESGIHNLVLHEVITDIGLVQSSPLEEDIPATIARLNAFYPPSATTLLELANSLAETRCVLVVADIAPLGILAAQAAGLPSLLIENFTWDWIYEPYSHVYTQIMPVSTYLASVFSAVNHHIQTQPVCNPAPQTKTVSPVSRQPRTSPQETRARLGVPEGAKMVLLTLGGIESRITLPAWTRDLANIWFVVPGGADAPVRQGNQILLPHHSGYFHPDLMAACDTVIGKLGYSTLSEAYATHTPYGFIPRKAFREYQPLANYLTNHMTALEIELPAFSQGDWRDQLLCLLGQPRDRNPRPDGAEEAAAWIHDLVSGG